MAEIDDLKALLAVEDEKAAAPPQQAASELDTLRATLNAPEPEADVYTPTALDRIKAFGQGAMLGASDELGAGISAGAVKLADALGFDMGKVGTLGEVYDDMTADLESQRKRYRDAAPGEAMAFEVAGGVLSPVSKIRAGGRLAAGGQRALSTLQRAPGGTLAAKGLGSGITQNVGRMGAEGAFYGAAAADKDADMRSAALREGGLGAGMAGGLGAAGKVIGSAFKGATRRRFAEDVVGVGPDGQELTRPLSTMPEDNITRQVYRAAANAFGSDLPAQTRTYRDAVMPDMRAELFDMNQKADIKLTNFDDKTKGLKSLSAARRKAADKDLDRLYSADTQAPISKEFRREAFGESLPAGADAQVRDALTEMPPTQASRELRQLWNEEGFKSAKGQKFKLEKNELLNAVDKNMDELDKAYRTDILKRITMSDASKAGDVASNDLLSMRSELRRIANAAGTEGDAALKRGAYSKAAKVIDDLIEERLPASLAADFAADRAAWSVRSTLIASVNRAKSKEGAFDSADWTSSLKDITGAKGAPLMDSAFKRTREAAAAKEAQAAGKAAFKTSQDEILDQRSVKLDDRMGRERKRLVKAREVEGSRGIKAKKEEMDRLNRLADNEPSIFNRLLASSMLALPFGAFSGPVGGAASSLGVSKGLSSVPAQKLMAGQTGTQAYLNKIAEDENTAKYFSDALRRTTRGGLAADAQ